MNVIFLDFDGVIDTQHFVSDEDIESKIAILAKICKKYECKVVIEAAAKDAIDEDTMDIDSDCDWVKFIFSLFNKYGIDCIGRTPNVTKKINEYTSISMWKEDEIRLYLFRHPEIDHYCVIDDDDLDYRGSDLNKVKKHLLKTICYSNNKKDEGLLESHDEEIKKILENNNEIKQYALKRKKYALHKY